MLPHIPTRSYHRRPVETSGLLCNAIPLYKKPDRHGVVHEYMHEGAGLVDTDKWKGGSLNHLERRSRLSRIGLKRQKSFDVIMS